MTQSNEVDLCRSSSGGRTDDQQTPWTRAKDESL